MTGTGHPPADGEPTRGRGTGAEPAGEENGHGCDDAAYVLGVLDPAERQRFERHLPACTACRTAVQELAGVPGLLARAGREGLTALQGDAPAEPPPGLLPALLAQVADLRRRRRRQAVLLVAAVLVAVGAGLGTAVVLGGRDTGTPSAGQVRMVELAAVSGAPLTAEVALTSRPWGTGVRVTCRYTASGGDPAMPYDLVVVGNDGSTDQAGSWRGLPGAEATVDGATGLTTADIAAVEIRLPDGRTVLRGTL